MESARLSIIAKCCRPDTGTEVLRVEFAKLGKIAETSASAAPVPRGGCYGGEGDRQGTGGSRRSRFFQTRLGRVPFTNPGRFFLMRVVLLRFWSVHGERIEPSVRYWGRFVAGWLIRVRADAPR